jgi:hypothetical protein
VLVEVFVEDVAHEKLLLPLLRRVAADVSRQVRSSIRSARGGHARAVEEMRKVQDLIAAGAAGLEMPDLFLVGIDGNCAKRAEKRKEITARTRSEFEGRLVIACPDPHIEKWYMADPDSFHQVVGARPGVGAGNVSVTTTSNCWRPKFARPGIRARSAESSGPRISRRRWTSIEPARTTLLWAPSSTN